MPHKMKGSLFLPIGLFLGLLLLGGCGSSSNSVTSVDPAAGGSVHPAGWLPEGHALTAETNLTPCTTCHGADLLGGITGVSCLECHIGTVTTVHPVTYSNYTWVPAGHSEYVGPNGTTNGTTACSNIYCHAADLSGVANSGPSCTSCHLGGVFSVHPATFNNFTWAPEGHAAYVGPNGTTNGTTACSNILCHAADLSGVADSGPSCTSCHLGGVFSVHPATFNNYTWVPAGHSEYVNINGTTACSNILCHAADLSGVANSGPSCTSCHIGTATTVHPAGWDTNALLHGQYVASNGTSACSNIYCHGANLTGVAASGPSCFSCHAFSLP